MSSVFINFFINFAHFATVVFSGVVGACPVVFVSFFFSLFLKRVFDPGSRDGLYLLKCIAERDIRRPEPPSRQPPSESKQEEDAENNYREQEHSRDHQGQRIAIDRHSKQVFPGQEPNSSNKRRGRHTQVVDLPARYLRLQTSYASEGGGGRAANRERHGSCTGEKTCDCPPQSCGATTSVTRKQATRTRQQASGPCTPNEKPVTKNRTKAVSARSATIRRTGCCPQRFMINLPISYHRYAN